MNKFDDLIGQEAMVRTIANSFAMNRIPHAYMLTGVRGVGKTTTARLLARALNYKTDSVDAPSVKLDPPGVHCEAIMESRHPDVFEMDAASRTGIGDIREILDSVRYAAPGRGLFHRTMLLGLGESLANRLAKRARPRLLVGHKLSIEGIAVAHAARLLGVPYAIAVQGNTDTRILTARPDLRPALARVWHQAAVVFPFAPWAQRAVEARLGTRRGTTVPLPQLRREPRQSSWNS